MPMLDMPLDELRTYTGSNPRPDDFDAYWDAALGELDATAPEPAFEPAAFEAPGVVCAHLYFTGVRGARIHAKLLRPDTPGPHPAVLVFHGYSGSSGDWADKLMYVALGFTVAALDVRGQGGRSRDPGGTSGYTLHGHIIRGLDDAPEDLFYRQVFLDTVQLARVVAGLPGVDANRLYATGASQGGALALACAALEPRVRRAAPLYPFLCDYRRVWDLDLARDAYQELVDYFRRFDPLHERATAIFTRLGYIDCQHLAPRIRGTVLMGLTLMDETCPPSTQFAAYNRITAPKEAVIYPDFRHEPTPGWSDRVVRFFLQDQEHATGAK